MTECNQCNAIIPDGMEYCENCEIKHRNKADESYLDSLLNSVIPAGTEAPRRNRKLESVAEDAKLKPISDLDSLSTLDVSEIDISDDTVMKNTLDDFEEFEEEEVGALNDLEDQVDALDDLEYEAEEVDALDDSDYKEEEVVALKDSVYKEDTINETDFERKENISSEKNTDGFDIDLWKDADFEEYNSELNDLLESLEDSISEDSLKSGKPDLVSEEPMSAEYNIFDDLDDAEFDKLISEELSQPVIIEDFEEDEINNDNILDAEDKSKESLLFEMEEQEKKPFTEDYTDLLSEDSIISDEVFLDDSSNSIENEDDMLAAIESAFLEEEIVGGEITEVDLLKVQDTFEIPEELEESENPIEVEEEDLNPEIGVEQEDGLDQENQFILTEDFNGASQENLSELPENPFDDILSIIDNISEPEADMEEEQAANALEVKSKEATEKKKKNFFQRIFSNVVQERTEEEKEQYRLNVIAEAEEKVKAEEDKKIKAEEDKEIEKKDKQQKAAEKKAANEAKKAEKAEAAKQKKLEDEEKKRQRKETMLAVVEEDEGRINRVGASILFTIFTALTIFIVVGTNMFFYNNSIRNANTNFEWQRYNEAYNDVFGLDLKPEDFEIYEKIMTVMYVNKQLNSYNNFYSMEYYSEALDSLLKGLQRYDKYIEFAKKIGIKSDMDYVRSQITEELETAFSVSEATALNMIALSDKENYSKEVLKITQAMKN